MRDIAGDLAHGQDVHAGGLAAFRAMLAGDRRASRYAARFCARLEPRLRALRRAEDRSWLGDLRRFYRLSDFGKLRHIERHASA